MEDAGRGVGLLTEPPPPKYVQLRSPRNKSYTIKVWYYMSYVYLFVHIAPLESSGTVCEDFSDYM